MEYEKPLLEDFYGTAMFAMMPLCIAGGMTVSAISDTYTSSMFWGLTSFVWLVFVCSVVVSSNCYIRYRSARKSRIDSEKEAEIQQWKDSRIAELQAEVRLLKSKSNGAK